MGTLPVLTCANQEVNGIRVADTLSSSQCNYGSLLKEIFNPKSLNFNEKKICK
jgi:hypothetical protein